MTPAAVTDAPGVAATSGRSVARRAKLVVLLVVAVVAVIKAPQLGSAVATAVGSAAVASPRWLALALTLAVGSMLAFAVLRRGLLRSTGDVIPWRSAVSIAYTAGAVRLTTPAGALLAVAHAFRRLRDLRVRPGAVTWSLAVGGVLSSAALTTLGLVAVAVDTGSSAVRNGMWGAAGAVAAAVAMRWCITHPEPVDRITQRVMVLANRLLRRADDAGSMAVRAAVAELRAVRATRAGWVSASAAAVLNWVLDLLCLTACAAAVDAPVHPMTLLVGYTAAMAAAGLSALPAGIGVLDGALVLALAAAGATTPLALAAVLLYRVVSHGHVLLLGWSTVAARSRNRLPFRAHRGIGRRWAGDHRPRRRGLRRLAVAEPRTPVAAVPGQERAGVVAGACTSPRSGVHDPAGALLTHQLSRSPTDLPPGRWCRADRDEFPVSVCGSGWTV
jgi:uncharacterized membrane protein YbhN (UPF0104 family)